MTHIEGADATDAINAQCDTALSDYDPPTNAELTAALAALNDISVSDIWAGITAAAANLIADHVHRRTSANIEASSDGDALSARSLYGAIARLTHKVVSSGGVLTTYKSDDSTSLAAAPLTTDADAEPVVGIDPP